MSRFIRSRPGAGKNGAAKLTGFTEAELAAAEWARALPEVRENYRRTTNAEVKGGSVVRAAPLSSCLLPEGPLAALVMQGAGAKDADRRNIEKKKKKEKKEEKEKDSCLLPDGAVTALVVEGASVKDAEGRRKEKKEKKGDKAKENKKERKAGKEKDKKEKLAALGGAEAAGTPPASGLDACGPAPTGDAVDALIEAARAQAARAQAAVPVPSSPSGSRSASRGPKSLPPPGDRVPRDPRNPLLEAQDLNAYREYLRAADGPDGGARGSGESRWNHEGFLNRSPSPCRDRTEGAWASTRRGAWRSRAGGVYMPPSGRVEGEEDAGAPTTGASGRPARARAQPSTSTQRSLRSAAPCRRQRRSPSYSPSRATALAIAKCDALALPSQTASQGARRPPARVPEQLVRGAAQGIGTTRLTWVRMARPDQEEFVDGEAVDAGSRVYGPRGQVRVRLGWRLLGAAAGVCRDRYRLDEPDVVQGPAPQSVQRAEVKMPMGFGKRAGTVAFACEAEACN
ncbi:unnamed protein product [Prorocentrum cordatum]|uniref:Uncharacterized protein n=1 Tax=Prorocentrum cordatum TaxID=2364126 RepID=A0ABN9VWR7_9DINO|nr:unnamed protein product [Polarella glacialis]